MFEDFLQLQTYHVRHSLAPFIFISPTGSNGRIAPASFIELFAHTQRSCFSTLGNTVTFPLQVIFSCLVLYSYLRHSSLLLIAAATARTTTSSLLQALAFSYHVRF